MVKVGPNYKYHTIYTAVINILFAETNPLILEKIILLIVFPIVFLAGKLISKSSEEEIKETKPVILIINKALIIISLFIVLSTLLKTITMIIILVMVLIYIIIHKQSPKEKVIIAIMSSISVLYLIETAIIICLIAALLKGISTHVEGEKVLTKHTALQTSLFFFMISMKFFVLGILTLI